MPDALAVLGAAALAVLTSASGVVPLALRRDLDRAWIGRGTAIAAGVMLAVSGGLALEGGGHDVGGLAAGAAAGVLFVEGLRRAFARLGELDVVGLAGSEGRRALLVVVVLTLHSAAEAIGLASSFAGGTTFGLTIALALAVHKLPEGFAISLALIPRGVSLRAAAGFGALAAAPLPALAAPAFLFVDAFRSILPAALGFAAGAMILVVLGEMVPEAVRQAPSRSVLAYATGAFMATVAFQAAVAALT